MPKGLKGFQKRNKIGIGNCNMLGKHHTEKSKRKMSKIAKEKGFGLWRKNKKHTKETKKKMSIARFKNNHFKGKYHTKETKKKISKALRGKNNPNWNKPKSKEIKEKISKAKKGVKLSEEHKKKLSEALKGKNSGEKSHFWKGGISPKLYAVNWTKILKISIRERDKYICQICKKKQGDKTFPVHHIDYDKKNCNPNNLITLCHNCHSKTNCNREYWIKYFKIFLVHSQ